MIARYLGKGEGKMKKIVWVSFLVFAILLFSVAGAFSSGKVGIGELGCGIGSLYVGGTGYPKL